MTRAIPFASRARPPSRVAHPGVDRAALCHRRRFHVVGRTSYCDYPPGGQSRTQSGDGIKPNIEAVLAQRPDLVVLYNSGQNAAVAGRLRELGVPHSGSTPMR